MAGGQAEGSAAVRAAAAAGHAWLVSLPLFVRPGTMYPPPPSVAPPSLPQAGPCAEAHSRPPLDLTCCQRPRTLIHPRQPTQTLNPNPQAELAAEARSTLDLLSKAENLVALTSQGKMR